MLKWAVAVLVAVPVSIGLVWLAYSLATEFYGRDSAEIVNLASEFDWLSNADANAQASTDFDRGNYRFYVACTGECAVPTLESTIDIDCYPAARLESLKGVTDLLRSETHSWVIDRAIEFGAEYNTYMVSLLEAEGLSACE